jgi:hypothetical protein
MSADRETPDRRFARFLRLALNGTEISRKASLFNSSVNSRFFKGLHGRGLGVGEARLCFAFGKRPAAAATSLNQQELHGSVTHSIANGGHAFALTSFA